MDAERHDELLTAYLDRELSPDERAAVDRLLENSPDARQRLLDLEATSRFLRGLPRRQLDNDFADGVIDRLRRDSLLRPAPVVPQRRRPQWGGWVGGSLAAAASLVLAVWIGRGMQRDASREVASVSPVNAGVPSPSPAMRAEAVAGAADVSDEVFSAPKLYAPPGPGDPVRIVSESGVTEVGLVILQQQSGDDGFRGILMESGYLPLRGAQPSAGEARDSIPTFVANDDDVQRMAAAVALSKNSAPIVDLQFELPDDDAASDLDRKRHVASDLPLQTRSADVRTPENASGDARDPTPVEMSPEKLTDASRPGAATGADKTAGRRAMPPAPAVADTPPAALPAGDAEKGATVAGGIGKTGTQTAEATPEMKTVPSRETPRKRRGTAGLAKVVGDSADKATKDSPQKEAAPDRSFDELKKLADNDRDSGPRSSKPAAANERLKVLLQFVGDTEPEKPIRRN